nr:E3 ubiquitin-protein ligase makorin-1-like [Zootoca vivipara]
MMVLFQPAAPTQLRDSFWQRGCCAYGDRCRYEHTKPLKREEVTTVSPAIKTYPSASTDVSPSPGTLEVSTGETEVEDKDLAAAGARAEDWVNAVEFVPGQPYCGRGKWTYYNSDKCQSSALMLHVLIVSLRVVFQ